MNFQIDFLTMFLQRLLNHRPVTCLTILCIMTSNNVFIVFLKIIENIAFWLPAIRFSNIKITEKMRKQPKLYFLRTKHDAFSCIQLPKNWARVDP